MIARIRGLKIQENPIILAAFFAFLCLAAHGLFIFSQGFYWDDWSQIFLRVKFGDTAYWDYFMADRPTSAWTNILFARFLQNDPRLWHLFIILLKFLTSIVIYRILRSLRPENGQANLMITSLYILCPLFSQIYISVAYTQHYLNALLFLLSVLFIILAAQSAEKTKTLVFGSFSLLLTLLHLSIMEYFAFLELIKLPLLFITFRARSFSIKKSFRKSFQFFLPSLFLFCIYCVYRLNYTKIFPLQEAKDPSLFYDFISAPMATAISFAKTMIAHIAYIFTDFVGSLFTINVETMFRPFSLFSILLSVLLFFLIILFFSKIEFNSNLLSGKPIAGYLGIGFLWIFLALLPSLVSDNTLAAVDQAHVERIFLPAIFGVALVFYALIAWLIPPHPKLMVAIAFLSAFFYHQQLEANNLGRQQTLEQNNVFWQLRTRMPALESNTAIVDEEVMFPFQGNFSTSGAINLLYENPINPDGTTPLWVFHSQEKYFSERSGYSVKKRNFEFYAAPSQSIFLDYENQFANCVWIFSPEDIDNPHLTEIQKSWIPHSDISRIIREASAQPDPAIFGEQPANWCTYYQKASLLRQFHSWDALAALSTEVLDKGFTPQSNSSNAPFEWWPFIESLIRSHQVGKAEELTLQAIQADAAYKNFFCNRWNGLLEETGLSYNTDTFCAL